ncbi:MAG TPA: hypothetical protein VMT77_05695 [Gemmatimonadales bacterium]|nr:hypothetical protein [Gemmatimonadales bacterium]
MTQATLWTALVASALAAAPLRAQDTTAAKKDTTAAAPAAPAAAPAAPAAPTMAPVKPGMSEADVRAAWGDPVAVRRMNDWTYLFYRNGREREVGYYDTVMLQGGQVLDAIVRSPDHVYAGQSSSPEGRKPVFTPPEAQAADTTTGAVTGVKVKPSR